MHESGFKRIYCVNMKEKESKSNEEKDLLIKIFVKELIT